MLFNELVLCWSNLWQFPLTPGVSQVQKLVQIFVTVQQLMNLAQARFASVRVVLWRQNVIGVCGKKFVGASANATTHSYIIVDDVIHNWSSASLPLLEALADELVKVKSAAGVAFFRSMSVDADSTHLFDFNGRNVFQCFRGAWVLTLVQESIGRVHVKCENWRSRLGCKHVLLLLGNFEVTCVKQGQIARVSR